MYMDIIGLILTVFFINLKYWYIVISLSIFEILFEFLLFFALDAQITQVTAGGIFSRISYYNANFLLKWAIPLFFIVLGFIFADRRDIDIIKIIDPTAKFKSPLPLILVKFGLARIIILLFLNQY
ncbi:MAG: hypothetical protein ACPLRZ_08105 [Thermovenabulum sp.]|uniref:hypothetical protein n=1 Tax=Thermovenabulum sp. TaxID=3100335 RepID=UPI003C7CDFB5